MKAPRPVRRVAGVAAAVILIVSGVALGPTLFRTEQTSFVWGGAFGAAHLEQPIGIAYGGGYLYVTDATADRVVVFDTAGTLVAGLAGPDRDLRRPMHLSRTPDGRLHVAEYLSDRITVMDSTGTVIERVGGRAGSAPGALDAPSGVAVRGDTTFVADFYNHRVQAFAGRAVNVLGRPGRWWAGRLHYPTDVAVDDSLVYVADAYNHRVQVFTSGGDPVRRWGGPLGLGIPGPFRGWFHVATGIEVASGSVYVADFYNDRIQVFTTGGRYLGAFADSLHFPTDVTVGPQGEVYVVDFGHHRIVRLIR